MCFYCVIPEEECRSHKVYCTLHIEVFFSFYFCFFPFHLKCSLVGQKNSSKKSHEMLFLHGSFIFWIILETVTYAGCGELQAVQCLPTCSSLHMHITWREAPCSAQCRQFSLGCLQHAVLQGFCSCGTGCFLH